MELHVDNTQNRISLWSCRHDIRDGDEILYSYSSGYNLSMNSPVPYTLQPTLYASWRMTPETRGWFHNVEGTGYCGYLGLIQLRRGGSKSKKLQMQLAADRKEVIDELNEKIIPDLQQDGEHMRKFKAVKDILVSLGDKNLLSTPWLPLASGLWMSTDVTRGDSYFLRKYMKFFLWIIKNNYKTDPESGYEVPVDDPNPDFVAYGNNQVEGLGQSMKYSNWKEYMGPDYKHLFYRDNHFFICGYENDVISQEFKSAFDNLVHRVVEVLSRSSSSSG